MPRNPVLFDQFPVFMFTTGKEKLIVNTESIEKQRKRPEKSILVG